MLLQIKSCHMYKKQHKQFYIAKIFPCQLYIFLHSLLHKVCRKSIKIEYFFSSIMRNVDSLIYKTRINRNSQILKKYIESCTSYIFIYFLNENSDKLFFSFNWQVIFLIKTENVKANYYFWKNYITARNHLSLFPLLRFV